MMKSVAPNKGILSKSRWRFLRSFVLSAAAERARQENEEFESTVSVRRFKGFELLTMTSATVEDLASPMELSHWNLFCYTVNAPTMSPVIVYLCQRQSGNVSLSDFHQSNNDGVDNTGNICMWPAEEVLAYLLFKQNVIINNTGHGDTPLLSIRGRRVLELGAGMAPLGGLFAAALGCALSVCITDGNQQAVSGIEKNICIFKQQCPETATILSSQKLRWDRHCNAQKSLPRSFRSNECLRCMNDALESETLSCSCRRADVIIASDCLFFKDYHDDLLCVIQQTLSEHGVAVMIAPQRGDSLSLFCQRASSHGLALSVLKRYDDTLWEKHESFLRKFESNNETVIGDYDPDIHYPLMVILRHSDPTT